MPSLASIPFGDDILYLYIGIRRLLRCPASHHSEDGPHEAVEREVPITQASSEYTDDVRVGEVIRLPRASGGSILTLKH